MKEHRPGKRSGTEALHERDPPTLGPGKRTLSELAYEGAASRSVALLPETARVTSHWGVFTVFDYRLSEDGVDIDIDFDPGPDVRAAKIGFTQSLLPVVEHTPTLLDPGEKARVVSSGSNAGERIDRLTNRTNPIYGSPDTATGELATTRETNARPGATPSRANATYKLGHRYKQGGKELVEKAWMHDAPSGDHSPNSSMVFESTVVAIEGEQANTYYGSVKWGFRINARGHLEKLPFELASSGTPSSRFLAAAAQWNKATARGTIVVGVKGAELFKPQGDVLRPTAKLDPDTRVNVLVSVITEGRNFDQVTVADGPHAGETGYVETLNLRDKGDGPKTMPLPVPSVQLLMESCALNKDVRGPVADVATLPKGTRVTKTEEHPLPAPVGQIWVKVVDGPNVGAAGYVPENKLVAEER